MNINKHRWQAGQSMVEYLVIVGALTAALIGTGGLGTVGFSKNDEKSLMQAMHDHFEFQTFALSISELPERRDLADLAEYYEGEGKFERLSNQLGWVGDPMGKFVDKLGSLDNLGFVNYLDPEKGVDLVEQAFKRKVGSPEKFVLKMGKKMACDAFRGLPCPF